MDKTQVKVVAIIAAVLLILLVAWAVYRQIEEYHLQDDPKLKEIKKVFEDFFKQERYWGAPLEMLNERDIMDETRLYRGNKSYTINKEKVYICLKDENGELYPDNMLIYVLAHEYSHVLSTEIGHTELFHTIFQALLEEMTKAGIYDPSISIDTEYCKDGDPEV